MLSKTTINYARSRRMEVSCDKDLLIYTDVMDDEYSVRYLVNDNSTFTFAGSLISQDIKEELPATIWDEKHLREVLEFLNKCKQ